MIGSRGSKVFARGLALYGDRQKVGLHDSLVLEVRDASRGMGVFVKDSVDAGTALVVLPMASCITASKLAIGGAPLRLPAVHKVCEAPLLDGLFGCGPDEWFPFVWRLAMERVQETSLWWGWLEALPSLEMLMETKAATARTASSLSVDLAAEIERHTEGVYREVEQVWRSVSEDFCVPPLGALMWSVQVALTRASWIPIPNFPDVGDSYRVSLGIAPYIDFVNHAEGEAASAGMELASSLESLPRWYTNPPTDRGKSDGVFDLPDRTWAVANGMRHIDSIGFHHYLVLCTRKPLMPSQEVTLDYGVVGEDMAQRLLYKAVRFGFA